jgi:hypothetical protein
MIAPIFGMLSLIGLQPDAEAIVSRHQLDVIFRESRFTSLTAAKKSSASPWFFGAIRFANYL